MADMNLDALWATFAGTDGERFTVEVHRRPDGGWAGECKELLAVELDGDSLDDLLDDAADAIAEQRTHTDHSWADVVRDYLTAQEAET